MFHYRNVANIAISQLVIKNWIADNIICLYMKMSNLYCNLISIQTKIFLQVRLFQ